MSLQKTETRSNRRRTDEARADHDLKVMIRDSKSRPSKAGLVRVHSSTKDSVSENSYQARVFPDVQDSSCITCHESEKRSVGVKGRKALKKVPTTPVASTRTEFDIVTSKKEDIGVLQKPGAARRRPTSPAVDGPGSPQSSGKGKVYIKSEQSMHVLYMPVLLCTLLLLLEKVEHRSLALKLAVHCGWEEQGS